MSITCQQNPETSRGLAPFTAVVFGVQPTFFSRVLMEVWLRGATAKRWGTKGGNKFLSLAQKLSKEVVSDVEVPGAGDARSDLRDSQKAAMTTLPCISPAVPPEAGLPWPRCILCGGCFGASFSKKLEGPLREKAELGDQGAPAHLAIVHREEREPPHRQGRWEAGGVSGAQGEPVSGGQRGKGCGTAGGVPLGQWGKRFWKQNCRSVVSWALSPGEGSPGGGSCL